MVAGGGAQAFTLWTAVEMAMAIGTTIATLAVLLVDSEMSTAMTTLMMVIETSSSSALSCGIWGFGLMLLRSREARRRRRPRCASDTSWSYRSRSAPGCTP